MIHLSINKAYENRLNFEFPVVILIKKCINFTQTITAANAVNATDIVASSSYDGSEIPAGT